MPKMENWKMKIVWLKVNELLQDRVKLMSLSLLYPNSEEPAMLPLICINSNLEVNAQPKRLQLKVLLT